MIKKLILTLFLVFTLTTNSFAAAISTLIDNFNDNSIDGAKWTASNDIGVTLAETNQEIEITSVLAGGYGIMASVTTNYDLTGSQASIQLVNGGNQALASWNVILTLWKDTSNKMQIRLQAGYFQVDFKIGGVWDYGYGYTAYVAATHKYFKIREASGTTYFDWSTDGISWTNFHNLANPFAITSVLAKFYAGSDVELSTTTAKVDDFNYPSTSSQVIIVSE